jgi:hypothetical protein
MLKDAFGARDWGKEFPKRKIRLLFNWGWLQELMQPNSIGAKILNQRRRLTISILVATKYGKELKDGQALFVVTFKELECCFDSSCTGAVELTCDFKGPITIK